jgi:hypothetical protein
MVVESVALALAHPPPETLAAFTITVMASSLALGGHVRLQPGERPHRCQVADWAKPDTFEASAPPASPDRAGRAAAFHAIDGRQSGTTMV